MNKIPSVEVKMKINTKIKRRSKRGPFSRLRRWLRNARLDIPTLDAHESRNKDEIYRLVRSKGTQ